MYYFVVVGIIFFTAVNAVQKNVFDLLHSGRSVMTANKMGDLLMSAVRGETFPAYEQVPDTSFNCSGRPPGFYADPETRCQGFHRCDTSGQIFNFICTPGTLFNQITLTCDWWFNVDCDQAKSLYDYANSRLYLEDGIPLFDNPPAEWHPSRSVSKDSTRHVAPDQTTTSATTKRKSSRGTPKTTATSVKGFKHSSLRASKGLVRAPWATI